MLLTFVDEPLFVCKHLRCFTPAAGLSTPITAENSWDRAADSDFMNRGRDLEQVFFMSLWVLWHNRLCQTAELRSWFTKSNMSHVGADFAPTPPRPSTRRSHHKPWNYVIPCLETCKGRTSDPVSQACPRSSTTALSHPVFTQKYTWIIIQAGR